MLEITLLGETVIRLHGKPIVHFNSQKEFALLVYLAHTGQTHSREVLADLLWEAKSTKQSLSNLRTVLARLRKKVGDYLIVTRKTLAIKPAVHQQTDSVRLQMLLAGEEQGGAATAVDRFTQGVALYKGDLLAGFYLPHTPRFNDWLVFEQERLRQKAIHGFHQLTSWQEETGAFAAGVTTARRWTAVDPLDEAAQQQLMRLLVYNGQETEALKVYEKSSHFLQTELGIAPSPATMALYEAIQRGTIVPPKPVAPQSLHNLPRALSPLFGRQKEIKKIIRYLLNPEYPLISITGVGGIGKTSLALAAARHLLTSKPHPFKDGIWFISLVDIENDTPENISHSVATLVGQAMGLQYHQKSDLWSQMLGQIAAKNLLLILDNIEQFLTVASDLIVDLLREGKEMQLLVTSRTALAFGDSVAFPLTGLETPTQALPEALQNESVRLFAARAARTPAPFQLEKHLAEVVAICQFVQGLPLGIELAAASLGRLMINEIMPALTSNLQPLTTKRSALPVRQRTLHATFDYSWQLLDHHEQSLLAQISIFHGGFTRQAAAAVVNSLGSGLNNLQYHALLGRDEMGRYHMHPLLRQLAREKLDDADMKRLAEQTLRRHSIYFSEFMASFADDLQCGEAQEALQTILPEQANLRAAWQSAVQAGHWQTIAGCLDSNHYFYRRKGFFGEEAMLIDSAITALQEEVDDIFLTALLSRLLAVRAWDYLKLAQFDNGVQTAERACELAQRLKNSNIEGQARLAWARILATQHKRESALAQFEQVVTLAKTAQNQILEADGWIGIGEQSIWLVDVKLAQEPLQHALDLCQTLQYKLGEMETLIFLGFGAHTQEDFTLSADYTEQALQLSRLLGDVSMEAKALGSLSVDLKYQGDLVGSQRCNEEALALFRRLNMPESEQWVLGEMGHTAIRLGDFATAEKQLTEALALATQLKDVFWQAWLKLRLGDMWLERGELDKALSLITEAFHIAEPFQYLMFQARVLYDWGRVLLSQADWAQAELKFQGAYTLWQDRDRTENVILTLAGLAYVTYQQEMTAIAAAHAEQLWQTLQTSSAMAERADLNLYWMLGSVWQGLGDSRADDLWRKANALLLERCEKITDAALRKMFLVQVPAHRAIRGMA